MPKRSRLTPLRAFLRRHRSLLWVTLLALVVRLVWNLGFHNPLDFNYSDMGGYLGRADEMLTRPWLPTKPEPLPPLRWGPLTDWIAPRLFGPKAVHLTLYPYGTHAFIAIIKGIFGRGNRVAIASSFAVMGTIAVAYTYATVARFTVSRRVRRAVGILLVVYYPWISLGGYALSEAPFILCVSTITFYGLRFADEGRNRDAWLLGIWLSIGTMVRPQVLVSVAFMGLLFLVRRRVFRRFRLGLAVRAAVPLALTIALSAWRVHWHMGTKVDADHLISTNGPLNRVFGRCHNTGLNAQAKDGKGFFGPPAFGALLHWQKEHKDALFKLDPAQGETITFNGHMWDAEPNNKVAAACVKKTGPWRQAKYMLTHVVLLWGYNIIWPDMGHKPIYRYPMTAFCVAHGIVIMPPALVAMVLAFRRRRARSMLLALHMWGLFLTSMLYFGDTRYRAPYDGILIILAFTLLPQIRGLLRDLWQRVWHERRARKAARRAAPIAP